MSGEQKRIQGEVLAVRNKKKSKDSIALGELGIRCAAKRYCEKNKEKKGRERFKIMTPSVAPTERPQALLPCSGLKG